MTPSVAPITSTTNPLVKALVRLRKRPARERTGTFLVEGRRELERAAAADVTIETVVLCPPLADEARFRLAAGMAESGATLVEMGEAPFRKIAYRSHPDGILGVAASWDLNLTRLELGAHPLVLVVAGVEKPGNLGAILRTADAAGVDAVIAADASTDLTNPNVIRSSQGAVFTVPAGRASTVETIDWCDQRDLGLIAGSDDAAESYWDVAYGDRVAIVVGAESAGLEPEWRAAARTVRIPMVGRSDSLNVSIAAALLLYEAARQRASI